MTLDHVVAAVLAWGGPELRDLPWRRTRDPWLVLVSEVMSQQTQVHRVIPKWERFVHRFPTAEACAAASLGEILELWQGLGYPRRARNLHLSAQRIAARGGVPQDLDELLSLPGVGEYTARAVLAFAFDANVAVIDTNVGRVVARLAGRRLAPREVRAIADSLVPRGDAWLWNQALMDLGGTICTARAPGCARCPVERWCDWRGAADRDDPAKGSAGVSRSQGAFRGSAREARGALLKALVNGSVERSGVSAIMDRPTDVAEGLLADLVSDGLCIVDGDMVRLP